MYGFSLKSGAEHFNQLWTIKLIHFVLVRRCPIMNRQAHPPSEFIWSHKHLNILCFFLIFMLKLVWVSILKYCTHEMRAFSKALKSRKRGVGALCWTDRLCPSHPDAHSRLCKTRRMTWIFFFFLVLISSFFSILAVSWHSKQLKARRKYSFLQDKIIIVCLLSPIPPNPPFAGGHLCTFVSCNCVNVPVS